jgi:cytochrome c-type biogenesis protein CcmH/NrfF
MIVPWLVPFLALVVIVGVVVLFRAQRRRRLTRAETPNMRPNVPGHKDRMAEH